MLVLTRKTNQSIMIGDDVEVSVLAVSRDKIRLGISAPREIPVFRKEVYLSIQEEREEERMSANKGVPNPNGASPAKRVNKALDKISDD
jgi:carbon storage regulator